jgi:hypothetical protein
VSDAERTLLADLALKLQAEVERLRGLIRVVVGTEVPARGGSAMCPRQEGTCWWCLARLEVAGGREPHREGCPWPVLVAEAELGAPTSI